MPVVVVTFIYDLRQYHLKRCYDANNTIFNPYLDGFTRSRNDHPGRDYDKN